MSVVIPAFNAADHIEAAVASALSPSPVPVEVVVVDDASTDETAALVERIAQQDSRVRLVRMTVNGGPSRARNEAVRAARYGWVALLDADDRFVPGRLGRLADVAEATGADVVSDEIEVVGLDGTRWPVVASRGNLFQPGDLLDPLDYARYWWVLQPVFAKHLFTDIGGFDESVAYGEDALLKMRWLLRGARWAVHPAVGYEYVRRRGSLTGGGGDPRGMIGVVEQLHQEALDAGRPDVARAMEARLRRARADAAFADLTRASGWNARSQAAVKLVPHLAELGRRAYDGLARRARLRFRSNL